MVVDVVAPHVQFVQFTPPISKTFSPGISIHLCPVSLSSTAQFLSCSFRGKEEEERAPAQRVSRNRGETGQSGRGRRQTPMAVAFVARPILDANWTNWTLATRAGYLPLRRPLACAPSVAAPDAPPG